MSKTIKTRIAQKHDYELNWVKATNFHPMAGEIIIYDAETQDVVDTQIASLDNATSLLSQLGRTSEAIPYQRMKVGNGKDLVIDLPFIVDNNDVDLSDYQLKSDAVGQKTSEGGEIFNNYDNNKATNSKAHAEGHYATAEGVASHAEGLNSTASGKASHAEGWETTAEKDGAHSEGITTKAKGQGSHAEGQNTTANGMNSHAEGRGTTANGEYSHSEGLDTSASGISSHAEGRETLSMGNNSHSEGWETEASGTASHTEGLQTQASGNYSHAEGRATQAQGEASHAGGTDSIAEGEYSFAHGINAHAVVKNSYALGTDVVARGIHSFVTGNETQANGNESFASGYATIANGDHSFVEGALTIANGENAHASGHVTIANGDNSYAGGYGTYGGTYAFTMDSAQSGICYDVEDVFSDGTDYTVILHYPDSIEICTMTPRHEYADLSVDPDRSYLHTECSFSRAFADNVDSFTVINATEAAHDNSFAHGVEVKTGRVSQVVFGQYNEVDDNALFIIGDGNTDTPHNAFAIKDNGTAFIGDSQIAITSQKIVDSDIAYVKQVPDADCEYAEIQKVGGMTYKDSETNTLKSTPVTEVESVGINIWDEQWQIINSQYLGSKNFIPAKPNTQYYLTTRPANGVLFYDADKQELGSTQYNEVFTTPANTCYMKFRLESAYGTVYKNDVCLNVYDTEVNGNYYPYIGNTVVIPEPVLALDGYGDGVNAECYNYIDFKNRQFVKCTPKVDLGTLTWTKNGTSQFYASLPKNSASYTPNSLCALYESSDRAAYDGTKDKTITAVGSRVWVMDSSYTDADANTFKTDMEGVMFYYELKTPEITDIVINDNFIKVESGGNITFKNEYCQAVPSTINLFEGDNDILSAKTIVGDLLGNASKAEVAVRDELGRKIANTYLTSDESIYATIDDINNLFD